MSDPISDFQTRLERRNRRVAADKRSSPRKNKVRLPGEWSWGLFVRGAACAAIIIVLAYNFEHLVDRKPIEGTAKFFGGLVILTYAALGLFVGVGTIFSVYYRMMSGADSILPSPFICGAFVILVVSFWLTDSGYSLRLVESLQ